MDKYFLKSFEKSILMKKISALLLCSFAVFLSFSQDNNFKDYKSFRSGEVLTYVVRYGFITGGEAKLNLALERFEDKMVYHGIAEARTTGLAEKLFSVVDTFESYFDVTTMLPYKAIRNVKEGGYKKYNEVFFHREDTTVYSMESDSIHKVPPKIMDMVSLLYYIRSIDLTNLKKGDVIDIVTFFDDEIFPFDVRYKGKEVIKSKNGKIRCLRFDPVVEPGRIFNSEDDMTVWISDDENLIPILVRFDLKVGSIKIELIRYSGIKYRIDFD